MKKMIIALTATAGLLTLSACNNGSDKEVIVETSAGNITKAEFYDEMKLLAGSNILKDMVLFKVLNEKYEVTDKELDARIKELKEQYGAQYDALVEDLGEDKVRDLFKGDMLKEKAAREQVKIEGDALRASHILVADEAIAKEVQDKLAAGSKFEELAAEYSQDGSAQSGGDLGWFVSGMMVAEFYDAAKALEIDQVSEPVQSQFGFHIIKLTGRNAVDKLETADKDKIYQSLLQANPAYLEDAIDEALKESKIEIKEKDLKDTFEEPKEEAAE